MDNNKKLQQIYARQSNNSSKACQSADSQRKSTDLQSNKPWPRNARRNDQQQQQQQRSNSKQFPSSSKTRHYVDKRPRARGGAHSVGGAACPAQDLSAASAGLEQVAYGAAVGEEGGGDGAVAQSGPNQHFDYELNSVYAPGSKKQNLNHLLNFHCAPRASDYAPGISVFGRGGGGRGNNAQRQHQGGGGAGGGGGGGGFGGKKHKYNKEQFLQANFQFVIRSSATPKVTASPDTLIDWNAIEQINIQTTEEPQCPICLYPPIAAKLTRCGHAYCWPCILHYLALSEKSWRKCPICYEAIHTADLRSCSIVQQQAISVGAEITFQLMRRKKGSMFIEPYKAALSVCGGASAVERYPQIAGDIETKLYSKFLVANRADIFDIIERERRELIADDDATCPEFVFIQQALDLLKERRDKLYADLDAKEEHFAEEEQAEREAAAEPQNETITAAEQEQWNITEYVDEVGNVEEAAAAGVETYDVSTSAASADTKEATMTAATAKYYYFYQAVDGQNIYLHPLNVKMLQACHGTLDRAPLVIVAHILQQEHHSMDEAHRRKFTCLGHLPLTCQFAVVEVDLQPPIITDGILHLFKDDILFRKKERQRRDREERKREKRIDEINDRQMGKLIASTANLNIGSSHEFPTFGFEEFLLNPSPSDTLDGAAAAAPTAYVATRTAAVATPNQHASYSNVAVVGGPSPNKVEYWPTLASPPSHNNNNYNNSFQELSIWAARSHTAAAAGAAAAATASATRRSSECDSTVDFEAEFVAPPMRTRLCDVLAEAISQKKQQNKAPNAAATAGGANKKNKKSKKMLPLFSTGMNYNGN